MISKDEVKHLAKLTQLELSDEELEKMTREEHDILLALIMDSYDQFTAAIAEGRKIPIEKVKTIADGRIYSGRQAQKLGLVDELGSYSDALALLQTMTKERYKLKADLAVDEDDDSGILASLMEGRAQLAPPGATSPLDKLSIKFTIISASCFNISSLCFSCSFIILVKFKLSCL